MSKGCLSRIDFQFAPDLVGDFSSERIKQSFLDFLQHNGKKFVPLIGNVPYFRKRCRKAQCPQLGGTCIIKLRKNLKSEGTSVLCCYLLKIRGVCFSLPIQEIRDSSNNERFHPCIGIGC